MVVREASIETKSPHLNFYGNGLNLAAVTSLPIHPFTDVYCDLENFSSDIYFDYIFTPKKPCRNQIDAKVLIIDFLFRSFQFFVRLSVFLKLEI